jgi:hypothetical protein
MQVVRGDGAAGQGSQSYAVRRARLDRAFISIFCLLALALTGAISRHVTAQAASQEAVPDAGQIAGQIAAPAIVDTGDASADPDHDGLTAFDVILAAKSPPAASSSPAGRTRCESSTSPCCQPGAAKAWAARSCAPCKTKRRQRASR